MLKRKGRILLAALLCATLPLLAATPECSERVSLPKLIANPDVYHGKVLWVVAHATINFENMTACPSDKEIQAKNCLWLEINDGPYNTDQDYARYQAKLQTWQQFISQTVAIRATFDKTLKGHFSMWPGGLGNVTEVSGHQGGWNFTTNIAVPRTACVGELTSSKVSSGSRWMSAGNLKLRNGDLVGAVANFSRAISLEPSNSGYYLIRANAKERKRDYAGAIADYTRAIAINPKFADAYHGRGLAKKQKGDAKGAVADLARAKQLAPAQSPP